ncbi:MAG TPA: hypothetical protein DD414_08040 [Lachnospiraceae bacterium]|nr:hypothetical protein [Lachnospiraceae bacterium]
MYYEVYVDVLFVENLCMNAILLFLTAWWEQAEVKALRTVTAAALGSLGACVLVVVSDRLSGVGYFLGSAALAAGMVCMTFGNRRHFAFRVLCLYMQSFVLNGILRYLEQFHRMSGVWFACYSGASAIVLLAAEYIFKNRKKVEKRTCLAILYHGGCRISIEALFDTGNGLYDPVSKRAVSILDQEVLKKLLDGSGKENLPRFIPYHTISGKGILTAYVLDGMELMFSGEQRYLKYPMVAVMPDENIQYKLILHRDLIPS